MAHVRCPQCNTVVEKPASGDPVCPNCGFGAAPAPAAKSGAKSAAKKAAKPATTPPPAAAPPPPPTPPAAPAWEPSPTTPFSEPPSGMAPLQKTSGKATAAMVVGIVSCCIGFVPFIGAFLALPAGIVALVLGILGLKEVNRDPTMFKGKGMAITGIVLGAIMVVLGAIMLIFVTVGLEAIEDYCNDPENADDEFCDAYADEGGNAARPGSPLARLAHALGDPDGRRLASPPPAP